MSVVDEPTEPISYAVVQAVSEAERRSIESLPPLYDAIDPDALDALHAHGSITSQAFHLSFRYSDSTVHIDDDELVTVSVLPTEESGDSEEPSVL